MSTLVYQGRRKKGRGLLRLELALMGKNSSRLLRRSLPRPLPSIPLPCNEFFIVVFIVVFKEYNFFLRPFSPILFTSYRIRDSEKVSCYCWNSLEGHSREWRLSFRPMFTFRKRLSKDTNSFSLSRLSAYESFNFISFHSFPFILHRWKIVLELYVMLLR